MNINILTDNNNNIILMELDNINIGYIYHYGDSTELNYLKDDINGILFDNNFEFGIGSDDMTIYAGEILNEYGLIKNEYNIIGQIKKEELMTTIKFCNQKSKDTFFIIINNL